MDTGAVVAARAAPGRRGRYDNASQDPGGGRGKPRLAVDVAPTAEDPAECATDKGYHSRLVLRSTAPGRISAHAEGFCATASEMMRLAGRSPTTGPSCYRGWPGKPSSWNIPRSSSAPLPTTSIAAVCAGPGFGAARTAQAIPASRRRPQSIVACANSSAPAPRRRPWRAELAPCSACYARWSRRWSFRSSSSSEDGETAFAR